MNADKKRMPEPGEPGYVRLKSRPPRSEAAYKHVELTRRIIKAFYAVYNELGPGFVESVYANAMAIQLHELGIPFEREATLKVFFHGKVVGDFRTDMVIEGKIIVELKAMSKLLPEHEAQILNYLRATDIEVGLLLNFGPEPAIKRFAFENSRKNRG